MKVPEHIVNLDQAPEQRWEFLKAYRSSINDLFAYYLNDIADVGEYLIDSIGAYRLNFLSAEYNQEAAYIASISDFTIDEVISANLYYDILKFYFGCTAFAFQSENEMFHARNLDWHTANNLLSKHTQIFDFQKSGKTVFKTVGWPGFIGALSGMKPNKFSVTLNAVLSEDLPQIAYPISFLIRDVLSQENSFEAAKSKLANTKIIGDCLLLLSGVKQDELVVIERSPDRFALRETSTNFIAVTNDYQKLKTDSKVRTKSILQETSCGRHDRALALLKSEPPKGIGSCLAILNDDKIKMQITVQQMVFNTVTGDIGVVGVY